MNCIMCRTVRSEGLGDIVCMCVEGDDRNLKMKYDFNIFATGSLRSKIPSRSHVILCRLIKWWVPDHMLSGNCVSITVSDTGLHTVSTNYKR
jgi:hypothetical protein